MSTPQFFIRDFTDSQSALLFSRKTVPMVLDDPSELSKVKSVISTVEANCSPRTQ